MSANENKERVKRLIEEGLNRGNESVIDELIAPNFVSAEDSMSAEGLDGFKAIAAAFRTAFPDGRLTIQDIIAEGDNVVTWAIFIGTNQGPLENIPPTGKAVRVKDVDLWRLENGKVVEARTHFDQLGMMQQLGLLGAMLGEEA
jgi:steroid delta-isomerase-like uncharacterized protein